MSVPSPGKPLWPATRRMLRAALARSARRVLAPRPGRQGAAATGCWTDKTVERLLADVDRCVDRLRPAAGLESLPNFGSQTMVELAVLTVATYRALLDQGHPRQTSAELVRGIGWDAYASGLTLVSLPARLTSSDPGVRLRRTIRLLLRFPFRAGEPNGYQVEALVEGDRIYTHWTRCPPQQAVRRIIAEHGDRGDLEMFAESWCRYDWPGADLIAADGRSGHYTRAHTLSRGDAVCDMCWRGTPEKTSAGAESPPVTDRRGGRRGAVERALQQAPLGAADPS